MMPSPVSDGFRLELLSVREREILDLASEGRTDEQIAQALRIAVTTVNSYWTRIRAKVGHYSRTELVARMLRLGFEETNVGLLREVERLSGLLAGATPSPEAPWPMLALHFVPEAVLVTDSVGTVAYANLVAEMVLLAEPGALVGRGVGEIAAPDEGEAARERIGAFLAAGVPGRMVLGVEESFYALRGSGEVFRATVSVEGFRSADGFMAVFAVREVLGTPENALLSVRRPVQVG